MPVRHLHRLALLMAAAILFGHAQACAAQTSAEVFSAPIDFCRQYSALQFRNKGSLIHVNSDQTVACFDGGILQGEDLSPIRALKNNGVFVIRSWGGIIGTALEMAIILEEKMAHVVIYDYCLSACAAFIYIASSETYVVKNSIVAWHAATWQPPLCGEGKITYNFQMQTLNAWDKLTEDQREVSCRWWSLLSEFFKRRGATPDISFHAQSQYVKKMIKIENDSVGYNRNQAWMWHPRNQITFSTKITYESYPGSQSEVDLITQRFRLPRVIYDP